MKSRGMREAAEITSRAGADVSIHRDFIETLDVNRGSLTSRQGLNENDLRANAK